MIIIVLVVAVLACVLVVAVLNLLIAIAAVVVVFAAALVGDLRPQTVLVAETTRTTPAAGNLTINDGLSGCYHY